MKQVNNTTDQKLSEKGNQVVDFEHPKNFFWMYGLEEYLKFINHPEMDVYMQIKKAVIHGNIWRIKELIQKEIFRGNIEHTDEFINILLAQFIGYEHASHRKVLRYISHCIDDDFVRTISAWSLKWEDRANLNDHFSRGQIKSKCWMIEKLREIFPQESLGVVAHYGGWYATIAKLIFDNFKVREYYNLELDPACIEIADDFNYKQYNKRWQFKSVNQDAGKIKYNKDKSFDVDIKNAFGQTVTHKIIPNIVINTSCEHMNEDWFHNIPKGMLICLQTNDYFENEQHVNCCKDLQQAMEKYPMTEVLYSGELDTHLYKRFMIIGEK